jgi:hypothetical protein
LGIEPVSPAANVSCRRSALVPGIGHNETFGLTSNKQSVNFTFDQKRTAVSG